MADGWIAVGVMVKVADETQRWRKAGWNADNESSR